MSNPSLRQRLTIAIAIALVAGAYAAAELAGGLDTDFAVWWTAARILVQGGDPYAAMSKAPHWPTPEHLFYPLPALLATLPVAWLPMPLAGGVMLGLASGVLAWALTRDGLGRLWLFASPGFVVALKVGQWSPVLTAAALLPALGWLAAVKPTLGIAALVYRLDWRAFAWAALFGVASIVVLPHWPLEWLANLHHVDSHPPPIATPLGVVLVLAALRWRTPEGRLLLAMACVPQLLFFADQLPVYLVARTRAQMAVLALCGTIAWLAWFVPLRSGDYYVPMAAPYVLVGVYWPALALVLFGGTRWARILGAPATADALQESPKPRGGRPGAPIS